MFGRKFQAYQIGLDWWVTIEHVKITDDRDARYLWTLRSLLFVTRNGGVVPCRDIVNRGYAPSRRHARAMAYRAALDASA